MAATISTQNHSRNGSEISRQEQDIQAAIAKAVELRALHAALVQGSSPAKLRMSFPSVSPKYHHTPHLSAQDYPVFTPSYEDEPLPGYQQILLNNQNYAETWADYPLTGRNVDEAALSDYKTTIDASSTKGLDSEPGYTECHVCQANDQVSMPDTKSRRNSLGEIKPMTSCNKCKPATISTEFDGVTRNGKKSNIVVPLADSHSSTSSYQRGKGLNLNLSRLFPRMRKKKNVGSPAGTHSEDASRVLNDPGVVSVSVETLKKELMEANQRRDEALSEVAEIRECLGELNRKLEYLETYCEDLKEALKQTVQPLDNLPDCLKPGNLKIAMPVSQDVIVECFVQIVSDARSSVRQLRTALARQMNETSEKLPDNIHLLLRQHDLSLDSKHSNAVLEAIINQTLYQDFENCAFQKNGTQLILDPQQDRLARFQSFIALRDLSWNEVLKKGTKYYSEEFSTFCDWKMSCVIATLGWTRQWTEQLLQAFFRAGKRVWLLHLLAFSFDPVLRILRVGENVPFDPHYMEDVFGDRQKLQGASRVKIMVMPGFYVHDRVIKCKVL